MGKSTLVGGTENVRFVYAWRLFDVYIVQVVHCKSRARPLDGRANAAAWISLTTAQTVVILWHDIFYEYTGSGLGGPNV